MSYKPYPFEVELYIYRRPFMRCDSLEMELNMGQSILRQIFDEMRVDESITEAYFAFPERWMNLVEEHAFYPRLARYCPNLKKVVIKTQSVLLIGNTANGDAKIVMGEEEQAGAPLPKPSDEGRLYFKNANLTVHAGRLNVLTRSL